MPVNPGPRVIEPTTTQKTVAVVTRTVTSARQAASRQGIVIALVVGELIGFLVRGVR